MKAKVPAKFFLLLAVSSAAMVIAGCGGGGGDPGTGLNSYAGSVASSSLGSRLPARTASTSTNTNASTPGASLLRAEIFTGGVPVATGEGPAGEDASAYTLTFNESFDGDLDRNTWNTGRTDNGNSVTNYGTSGGSLKVWAERGNNGEFFDRTLDTDGHFSQRYGFFEIEAKLPKGKGAWPAFWLFNQFGERRPEIDILEAYPGGEAPWGAPDANGIPTARMYAPVVWNDAGDRAGYGKIETPDLSADFHKYGVKWEPGKVTFYFDGVARHSIDATISDPLYIILDLWFGSASGSPDGSTPSGAGNAFEVNYVKAWQFR